MLMFKKLMNNFICILITIIGLSIWFGLLYLLWDGLPQLGTQL